MTTYPWIICLQCEANGKTIIMSKGRKTGFYYYYHCPECKGNRLIPVEEVDSVCPTCGQKKEATK